MSSRLLILFVGFVAASSIFRLLLFMYAFQPLSYIPQSNSIIAIRSIKQAEIFSKVPLKSKEKNAVHLLGGVTFLLDIIFYCFGINIFRKKEKYIKFVY